MTGAVDLTLASPGIPTDERALVAFVDAHVGHGLLDRVVDDGSRHYAHLRTAFEVVFPRLRPGGRYEIRGWNWAHRATVDDQERPAATNLLVELLALVGSDGAVASEVIVGPEVAVVVRGDREVPSPFRLAQSYRNRGIAIRPLL